jgi:hypothetical protein
MIKSILLTFLCVLTFLYGQALQATYIQVYSTINNGGLSWTGNTLGLNKALNQNEPGTAGSIGAFSTNLATQVGSFPSGTTLNWQQNRSSAVLDLPSGSTVLYAELVWGGSYGFDPTVPVSVLDTPITFITPNLISHTITPNPATAQIRVDAGNRGFYVRSADVTSLVNSSGTYAAGGIPGTIIASENLNNCAGWTLQVAYQNPNSLTSNLTLFVACEKAGDPPALVSGFHAPDTGNITSRLFICALEGDAQSTGDRLLVGANLPLTYPADRVFGSNNPASNFFASQINTLLPLTTELSSGKLIASGSSVLDTRGSFGTTNSLASGTSVFGARQGYDITSVDLGSIITNGQQQVYVQGTTAGEGYTITGLGLTLEVNAPIIRAEKQANVTTNLALNDLITFTMNFTNIGGDASALVFKDLLPNGLTYEPNTFLLNGSPILSPDLINGVPIGNLNSNATSIVSFQARVTQINPPTNFLNTASVDYNFTPFQGQAPITLTSQTNQVVLTAVSITPPIANPDSYITTANTTLNAPSIFTNDQGTDITLLTNSNPVVVGASVTMQPDGEFSYTPAPGFSGTDSFTYQLKDIINQSSNVATVTITVLPLAKDDSATVTANTTLNQTSSVLSNDLGSSLSVTSFNLISVQGGNVNVQANGTYTYIPPLNFAGQDSFNYRITDSIGNTSTAQVIINVLGIASNDQGITPANTTLNGTTVFSNDVGSGFTLVSYTSTSTAGGSVVMSFVDGSYVYNPPLNFSGVDTFSYTVRDPSNNLSTATVTILVTPQAINDNSSTTANTALNGTSVLTNDIGSNLSILNFETESINGGTVTMNGTTGAYTYNPPFNFSGVDTFTYTLRDGVGSVSTATVSITVSGSTLGNAATTLVNTALVGPSVLTNATGTALQVIAYDSTSTNGGLVSMNADGTYTYRPPTNFSGIDTFTYTAVDGAGSQSPPATVTITVLPLALNDSASTPQNTPLVGPSVLLNDLGSNLQIASYQSNSIQGGTVVMNSDGSYLYTPPFGFIGVDSFTYTLEDTIGSLSTGTVTIFVTPINPPSSFVGIVKKCKLLNKTTYRLATQWTADPSAAFYRIYFNGMLVSQISSSSPLQYETCLSSKNSASGYEIASVDSFNTESTRVKIRIIND